MAVQFLGDEWMAAIASAANADESFRGAADNVSMALQFHVTDVPDGDEVHYVITINDGEAAVTPGVDESADATVTNTHDTAMAISKGDLNIQTAFITGKLKIRGNMAKLMMHQSAFNQFAKAASAVDIEY